jgi:hypothetical protein
MKCFLPFILGFLFYENMAAQNKTISLNNYSKISLLNLDGNIKIELGKPFSILLNSNKNVETIKTEVIDGTLNISINKEDNNYNSINKVNIIITMPQITALTNNSNANVNIENLNSKYLAIKNYSNGNVQLNGQIVNLLEIENYGNGNTNAKSIEAKIASVKKTGNGDVNITCNSNFSVTAHGNGDVINFGKGQATIIEKTGNGEILYK